MKPLSPVASRPDLFIRFLWVGLANTAFGYGVYAVAVLSGVPAQAALALQFCLSIFWNYSLHARLVFAVTGWNRLPSYILGYVLIYLLNASSLHALLRVGVNPLLSQTLILPGVVALSWLVIGRIMSEGRAAS